MNILYHGSSYKQTELKPGIAYTGKKVEWDETESNEFLYATTDRQEAISQAFASMLEKHFGLTHYQTSGKTIKAKLEADKLPPIKELVKHKLYLYTIVNKDEDGWKKNSNKANGLETEYKTQDSIKKNILKVKEIDLEKWLDEHTLKLSLEGLASFRW